MKKLILGSYEVSEDTKAEATVPTSTDITSVFSSPLEASRRNKSLTEKWTAHRRLARAMP
jgi:hypothetical protein